MNTSNNSLADVDRGLEKSNAESVQPGGTERERLEAHARFSALMDAATGEIHLVSQNYDIELANRNLVQRLGRSPVGEKCFNAIYGVNAACSWCPAYAAFKGQRAESQGLIPAGDRLYHMVCEPVHNPDGSISSICVKQDVTDSKTTELELARVKEGLEERVNERTAQLSRASEALRKEVADHKASLDELQKSRQRYKELAELLPQIVFEIDPTGHITFMNCSGLDALGYNWEELTTNVNYVDLVVPEDRARIVRSMEKVLRGEKLRGAEYAALRKDGPTFPILVHSNPVIRDGVITGIRGVAVDITDLRQTQERLWIKNSAIASSFNGIAMADLQGNLTYVNPSFLNMWGYESPKEVLGRSVIEFWETPAEAKKVAEAVTSEGWWTGELLAKRHGGSTFHAQISANVVTDETGAAVCMMASFLDITRRKLAEEALRISEERFRAVFEGAGDCIFIKDRARTYTHVNPAVERLLGRPASAIVGRSAREIFGHEAGERIREVHLRVLKGERIEEERTRPVKGDLLVFHEVSVPLHDSAGKIVGTCTISRNVTERMKTQPVARIAVRDYPSEAMRVTLEKAQHAAARDGIVLLHGESGSGKDYVAQWIHSHSRRANGPFFAINCAALPHDLAESELFGHEAGAFTGARSRKRGMLELAEGGTILLNEIGELSLPLQSKLLAFLDSRSFLRVGGEKSIHINARLIAATHRDLGAEVAAGRFLQALFYRLNVFSVHVSPLRNRTEDIPVLVEEIMSDLVSEMQLTEMPILDPHAMTTLKEYHWPGNVRELRNVLERSLMLWDEGPLRMALTVPEREAGAWSDESDLPTGRTLREARDEITKSLCVAALRRSDGRRTKAAQLLGISRYSLYRYVKEFGLECENVTNCAD